MVLGRILCRTQFPQTYFNAGTQTEDDAVSTCLTVNTPKEEDDTQPIMATNSIDKKEPLTSEEIKREYARDSILAKVVSWITGGQQKPTKMSYRKDQPALIHYWKHFDQLTFKDGILYRKWVDEVDTSRIKNKIVIPCTLIEKLLFFW